MQEILEGRLLSVSVAGILIDEVAVTSAVPLVFVLKPLLVLIYLDVTAKCVIKPWVAYADYFDLSVCPSRGEATDSAEDMHNVQRDVICYADSSRS